jgi:hypothetical protein
MRSRTRILLTVSTILLRQIVRFETNATIHERLRLSHFIFISTYTRGISSISTTPNHATHSRMTSSTLFHYSPLSTTSSTLFHYAPLSSPTSNLHSYPPTTTLSQSTTFSRSRLPASTGQLNCLLASSNPTPSATKISSPNQPLMVDSEISSASMGFTVVILTILGSLMALTIIIWWTEIYDCENYRNSEKGNRLTTLSQTKTSGPVGLGIMMQCAKEGKTETRLHERLRGLLSHFSKRVRLVNTVERWLNAVVAKLRDELDTDGEEGLLLHVRESERIGEREESDRVKD